MPVMSRGAYYSTGAPQYSPGMQYTGGIPYGGGPQQYTSAQYTAAGPQYTAGPGQLYQGPPPTAPLISTYANGARQPNFNQGPGVSSCCMGICDDDGGPVA